MGMGYSAGYADVVEWGFIKELVSAKAVAFEEALNDYELSLDDFAKIQMEYDGESAEVKLKGYYERLEVPEGIGDGKFWSRSAGQHIEQAWFELRFTFAKATAVNISSCLELDIGYHSEEDGDRYDEVSDAYYYVSGVHELTLAGKKFKEHIERKFYVSFG